MPEEQRMFETINDRGRPPLALRLAGFGIVGGVVALIAIWPLLMHSTLDFRLVKPASFVWVAPPPVDKPKPAPAARLRHQPGGKRAGSTTTAAAQVLRPGTPIWERQVARGTALGWDVVVDGSAPLLRNWDATLAFDLSRPRGESLLLNLGTKEIGRGPVPGGVVTRLWENVPGDEDVQTALKRAQREAGEGIKVYCFALWPQPLYAALRGFSEQALRDAGAPVATVTEARVAVTRVLGGKEFAVRLVSYR